MRHPLADQDFYVDEAGDPVAYERTIQNAKARGNVVMVHRHRYDEPCVLECFWPIIEHECRFDDLVEAKITWDRIVEVLGSHVKIIST
jgi:hypothetical protein